MNKPPSIHRQELDSAGQRQIETYINTALEGEIRITVPIHPQCQAAVVLPVYSERTDIFRPLLSLARQQEASKEDFELILVVNNPPEAPQRSISETTANHRRRLEQYAKARDENAAVLAFAAYLNGDRLPHGVTREEHALLDTIGASGLRVHTIDKASPGKTFPTKFANVGSARNRGLAESAGRFFRQLGRNGIVALSDADVRFHPRFIRDYIDIFAHDPQLVGVSGRRIPEVTDDDPLLRQASMLAEVEANIELFTYLFPHHPSKVMKQVLFIGQNMACRAFEAALAGGIRNIPYYEDEVFGFDLAKLGNVVRISDNRAVAYPADRPSSRVTLGHGVDRWNAIDALATRDIQLPTVAELRYRQRLRHGLIDAIEQKQYSPDDLRTLCAHDGKELLSQDESESFAADLREKIEDFLLPPERAVFAVLKDIRQQGRFLRLFPRVSLAEGVKQLVAVFADNSDVREAFERDLQSRIAENPGIAQDPLHLTKIKLAALYEACRATAKPE
jgi:hypothetical protein